MTIRSAACGVLASALAFSASATTTSRAIDWPPALKALPSPAAERSAQAQLSSSDRGIVLSWIEQSADGATLKYAERIPDGWSEPRPVASGSDWFVNWADVPSVMRLADGTYAAHWLQKSGASPYAYDVRLSHSTDGRTWSPPMTPHSDARKTEHGFASLFQLPGAGLGLVWLDGRAGGSEPDHGGHGGGDMSIRFGAFDKAWKQTAETAIDVRVCECCPTAAAVTSEGPIVAFRNRSEGEIRDIYVSRLEQGRWTEPRAVFDDGWKINACPVNGPMLSARGPSVALAWFTAKGEEGHAFVAFSQDAGRTFGAPIRLDDAAALGRVDVELMADGSAVASWIEFADQRAQFRARRVDRSGTRSAPLTVATIASSRASGYPRLAAQGDELVFAWMESQAGTTRLQTSTARIGTERGR